MDGVITAAGWAAALAVIGLCAAADVRKNRRRQRYTYRQPMGDMGDQRWHDLVLEQGVIYGAVGANEAVEELLRLHGYNRTADAWKAELRRAGAWEKCGA